MPARKTPKKTMLARTVVASSGTTPSSPDWQSGSDVIFNTPKSPSPVRRVTRRSSIYQRKPASSDISKFKMPKIVSPPGVKTRARRSSIYQKGGGRLLSPSNLPKTRRASMYVSSKTKPDNAEFSKVFHTPMKIRSSIAEVEEATKLKKSSEKNVVKGKTPRKRAPSRSPSPVKSVPVFKSPPIPTLRSRKISIKSPEQSPAKKVTSAKKSTPAKQTVNTPKENNPTPSKTPRQKKEVQKSVKKTPVVKKSPAAKRGSESEAKKENVSPVTSTPSKNVEEMTGKSFYSTPGETPILPKQPDVLLSAQHTKQNKSQNCTPKATPLKQNQKKAAYRKTPAVKRLPVESGSFESPASKVTASSRKLRSLKGTPVANGTKTSPSMKLSPAQKTTVLKFVTDDKISESVSEKRKSVDSISPRPRKLARLANDAAQVSTPRVVKTSKKFSPKKLAKNTDENNSNFDESSENVGDVSLLNETINTDSRSSRCIIL